MSLTLGLTVIVIVVLALGGSIAYAHLSEVNSKLPCDGMLDTSTNVPLECATWLWKQAGCTTSGRPRGYDVADTYLHLKEDAKYWATEKGDAYSLGCYGKGMK